MLVFDDSGYEIFGLAKKQRNRLERKKNVVFFSIDVEVRPTLDDAVGCA